MAKLIDAWMDWEHDGVLKLYFGDDSVEGWYGDDWDDYPWESNAGAVYDRFVDHVVTVDVAGVETSQLTESWRGCYGVCRLDQRDRSYPLIILSDRPSEDWIAMLAGEGSRKIYMGDAKDDVLSAILEYGGGVLS